MLAILSWSPSTSQLKMIRAFLQGDKCLNLHNIYVLAKTIFSAQRRNRMSSFYESIVFYDSIVFYLLGKFKTILLEYSVQYVVEILLSQIQVPASLTHYFYIQAKILSLKFKIRKKYENLPSISASSKNYAPFPILSERYRNRLMPIGYLSIRVSLFRFK
jgi:hypothetical protein